MFVKSTFLLFSNLIFPSKKYFYLSKLFASSKNFIYLKERQGVMKKLNQGGKQMRATFCETNNGKGFKIAIDDKWLFASKENLLKVLFGEAKSCQFNSIENKE